MAHPIPSDRDFTEKLIEEVKRHPILYNPKESGYKDRNKMEDEWRAVAAFMGCSSHSAKKRWQNLRGSYSRSRSTPSGSPGNGKPKPPFYLAKQMSFLEPHMQHGYRIGNLDYSEAEFAREAEFEREASPSIKQEAAPSTHCYAEYPTMSSSSSPPSLVHMQFEEESDSIDDTDTPHRHRKRAAPSFERDTLFEETATKYLESKLQKKESNPDHESLRGLLPHMANLTDRRKIKFLRKTYNLIFELLEEQDQEEQNTTDV